MILSIYALHQIIPFLLPLVLAILVSLVLHPAHRFLRRMRLATVGFEEPGLALLLPETYLAVTAIEGNIITPMALGGRFRINPLIVIAWRIAWAAIWGIADMLIAMPALVIFNIACENTTALHRFQRILIS